MTTPPPQRQDKKDKRAAALRENLRKRQPVKKAKAQTKTNEEKK